MKNHDLIIIWNGECRASEGTRKAADKIGIRRLFMEVAYFPQDDFFVLDRKGINANSELMDSDFSHITEEDIDAASEFREDYSPGCKWKGNSHGYILVPLQVPRDSNVLNNSSFRGMQQFIDFVEGEYPDKEILFKLHPKDKSGCKYKVSSKNSLIRGGDFNLLIPDCIRVVGINSTCLLQAALNEAPVVAYGEGFLSIQHDRRKVITALVKAQIPIDSNKWSDCHIEQINSKIGIQ